MMPHSSFEIACHSDLVQPSPHLATTTKPEVVSTSLCCILLQEETFLLLILSGEFSLWTLTGRNTMDENFKILDDSRAQFLSMHRQSPQEFWQLSKNMYFDIIVGCLHWIMPCGWLGYINDKNLQHRSPIWFLTAKIGNSEWKLSFSPHGTSNVYHQDFYLGTLKGTTCQR